MVRLIKPKHGGALSVLLSKLHKIDEVMVMMDVFTCEEPILSSACNNRAVDYLKGFYFEAVGVINAYLGTIGDWPMVSYATSTLLDVGKPNDLLGCIDYVHNKLDGKSGRGLIHSNVKEDGLIEDNHYLNVITTVDVSHIKKPINLLSAVIYFITEYNKVVNPASSYLQSLGYKHVALVNWKVDKEDRRYFDILYSHDAVDGILLSTMK